MRYKPLSTEKAVELANQLFKCSDFSEYFEEKHRYNMGLTLFIIKESGEIYTKARLIQRLFFHVIDTGEQDIQIGDELIHITPEVAESALMSDIDLSYHSCLDELVNVCFVGNNYKPLVRAIFNRYRKDFKKFNLETIENNGNIYYIAYKK